jgi:hypothetical protein
VGDSEAEEMKPFPQIIRETFSFGANSSALVILAFLLFNFAYAPWSINPINDLLYVRSAGFLLPANHISSAIAVCGTAIYFAIQDTSKAFKLSFVILSTASIHEYVLDFLSVPNMISDNSLSYTVTFRWFFWLAFFLIPGVYFATKRQRIILLRILIFCVFYIGAWIVLANFFGINTFTILAYAPGPAYYSFLPNFFEVTSWVIPASFWWIWK